jgi:hypothetical protein
MFPTFGFPKGYPRSCVPGFVPSPLPCPRAASSRS